MAALGRKENYFEFNQQFVFISLSLFIGEWHEIDLPEIEPARSIDFVSLEAPSYIIDGYWSGVELDGYNMPKDSIPERTFIRLDGDFSCPYGKVYSRTDDVSVVFTMAWTFLFHKELRLPPLSAVWCACPHIAAATAILSL